MRIASGAREVRRGGGRFLAGVGHRGACGLGQITPNASIASAMRRNPTMFAPLT